MASTARSGTDGPGRPVVVVGIDGSDDSVHHATRPLVLVPA